MAVLAVLLGLVLLVWSADRFVAGSADLSRYFGLPPLLIGMVVVGFGTSAPEMVVSVQGAWQGSSGIALGNAFGSNITNIALILGLTSLIRPITVHSRVLKAELPILAVATAITVLLVSDLRLSRWEAGALLGLFAAVMGWMVWSGTKSKGDPLAEEMDQALSQKRIAIGPALLWTLAGLALLVLGSRLLVWGAVIIATWFNVSDLVIGLTVIAVGTSLPELASSVSAARRGEHEIILGNILGSNLFNTLAVLGIAGLVRPLETTSDLLYRDVPVMAALTVSLFLIGYGFRRRPGRISRAEGAVLTMAFLGYTAYLLLGF